MHESKAGKLEGQSTALLFFGGRGTDFLALFALGGRLKALLEFGVFCVVSVLMLASLLEHLHKGLSPAFARVSPLKKVCPSFFPLEVALKVLNLRAGFPCRSPC